VFAPPAPADASLTQGFEDGAPAWSTTGMWHVQSNPETIAVSPAIAGPLVNLPDGGQLPAAFQGTRAAWFGEAATGTYCGADFASIKQTPQDGCTSTGVERGELTSPSFSLAGRADAFVTFRAWWEIQAVRPNRTDLMQVEYSTDGGTVWYTAASLNPLFPGGGGRHDSITPGVWQSYTADLRPAAGQPNVRVRFVFDTVDRFRNGFRGLLIDSVAIVDALGVPISDGSNAFTDTPAPSVTAGTVTSPAAGPSAPGLSQVLGIQQGGGPTFEKTFELTTLSGTVRYHPPGGKYVPLPPGSVMLPLGSVVDASKGHAQVTVESDAQHTLQQVEVWDGKAGVFQSGSPAVTELRLAGGDYSRCATASRKRARRSGNTTVRRLWASAKGRFRTKGRFASATVRGTKWLTEDLCSATRVSVAEGVVAVRDYRRHKTIPVPAGNQVTVVPLRTGRYSKRSGRHPARLSRA
jgi:hypothetical protein